MLKEIPYHYETLIIVIINIVSLKLFPAECFTNAQAQKYEQTCVLLGALLIQATDRWMVFSGMLRRVALVRNDITEELSPSIFKLIRILRSVRRLLVKASAVPSSPILVSLLKEALRSSETSVLTIATRHSISEDTILHIHCPENLKSYKRRINYRSVLLCCRIGANWW
jgi:hypothetical protein